MQGLKMLALNDDDGECKRNTSNLCKKHFGLTVLVASLQRGAVLPPAATQPKGNSRWVMCEAEPV